MIDTLKVFTDDFEIRDNAQVFVQPATIDYETGEVRDFRLFRASNGQWVKGAKAFVNSPCYQLTIKPILNGDVESESGRDNVKMFIQSSLPKVLKGENYYALNDAETVESVKEIERDLQDRGVGVNFGECSLSRLDAFRVAVADNPFQTYSPLFRLLNAKRKRMIDYGTTFLWSNTQRELCVYDKGEEMRNRGITGGFPANSIRFEYRLLNSRVCKKETGARKVRDLVNNLDGIRDLYEKALTESIFSTDAENLVIVTAKELEHGLRGYALLYGNSFVSRFIRDFGAFQLSQLVGAETVKTVLESVLQERNKIWRQSKLFDEYRANFEYAVHADGKGETTLRDLYNELREKVLSPVSRGENRKGNRK